MSIPKLARALGEELATFGGRQQDGVPLLLPLYPVGWDDPRNNPYHQDYNYNYDATWHSLLHSFTIREAALSDVEKRHIALWRLFHWLRKYCDPNTARCDRCAIKLLDGPYGGVSLEERDRNPDKYWPLYRRVFSAMRYCDTGGDGTCQCCTEEGRDCTVMGLSAESWAVKEHVRGRDYWWYEGVGKVACVACISAKQDINCDIWRDNGCTACRYSGLFCAIRGHRPGSYDERISRRDGYETNISELKPEVHDSGRDLHYLLQIATGQTEGPGEPPNHMIPKRTAVLLSLLDGITMRQATFATLDEARDGLVTSGVILSRFALGLDDTFIRMVAHRTCKASVRRVLKTATNWAFYNKDSPWQSTWQDHVAGFFPTPSQMIKPYDNYIKMCSGNENNNQATGNEFQNDSDTHMATESQIMLKSGNESQNDNDMHMTTGSPGD
ncbi:hypothetical protein BKA67DRAFT_529295 [Truncatella angustata]|uniref:Uncharacterized protein n=1 Tax=Truncatella angustata TaxID=152316 RepID=A0A9P8UVU0_9PEZI|nr:uncharacterized protein BKA67DRAFT_529295 [Truncatella angustata]KAH6659115.1 hypothetical protein BKA67DRAFT_529295 [Truncatella angustata]